VRTHTLTSLYEMYMLSVFIKKKSCSITVLSLYQMTQRMRSWKILFDVSVYSKIKIVILLSSCWRCIPFSVHLSIHTTSFTVSQMSKVHKETVWNLYLKIHSFQNWNNMKTSKNVPLAASTHGMKQATSSNSIRLLVPIWKEVPALQTEPRHTAS
jgi:hypothetical protein